MPASDLISCSSVSCFRVYGFRLNPKSARKNRSPRRRAFYSSECTTLIAVCFQRGIDSFLSLAATFIHHHSCCMEKFKMFVTNSSSSSSRETKCIPTEEETSASSSSSSSSSAADASTQTAALGPSLLSCCWK